MSKFLDLNGLTSLKKKIESWIDTKVSGLSKGLIYMDVEAHNEFIYIGSDKALSNRYDENTEKPSYPPLELHQGYIINASCYTAPASMGGHGAAVYLDVIYPDEEFLIYSIKSQSGIIYNWVQELVEKYSEDGGTDTDLYFIYRIK